MTVIVYRDGVLASEGRSCVGSTIMCETEKKVFRCTDGSLAAGIGLSSAVDKYIEWLSSRKDNTTERPSLSHGGGDAIVLCVRTDGILELHDKAGILIYPKTIPFVAIGSGKEAALGALHMGANAVQAVEIACKVDVYCGGEVQSLALQPVTDNDCDKSADEYPTVEDDEPSGIPVWKVSRGLR